MNLIRIYWTYSNPHMCQSHDLPYPRSASRIGNPFLQSRWPKAHAWERLLWIPLISWTITDWKKMSGMIYNVHECIWMYDMHLSTDGEKKQNEPGWFGTWKAGSWENHIVGVFMFWFYVELETWNHFMSVPISTRPVWASQTFQHPVRVQSDSLSLPS